MKVIEESEKVGLTLNIQKSKIMSSCPITSWEIDGEAVETVADFIFLGCKITADGDCSHEIKRHLLLGRKVNGQRLGHINFWDTDFLKFNVILLKYFLALFPYMCKPTVY